jgi:hypothetical protein
MLRNWFNSSSEKSTNCDTNWITGSTRMSII